MGIREKKAIKLVIAYEKKHGRTAVDCSNERCIYDVKSSGRLIEVKSRSAKGISFAVLQGTIKKLSKKEKGKFYLYYVRLGKKPSIRIVLPSILFKNLQLDIKFRLPASVISNQKEEKIK